MIVRLAVPGAVIDMTENAEPEFRILVEDLPFGHIVTEVSCDERIVLEDVLDERTDLLAALDARILRQHAVTLSGKLFESVAHHQTSSIRMHVAS
jgi:hypothetical protein